MAAYQYVYVMKKMSKIYPGGKKVLDDIWLSFLPGAKIGVLGLNGAGKSTLLKIMAGRDKDTGGESFLAQGATSGYLEQEPQLDPKKTVAQNVMEGMGPLKTMVDRFEEVSAKLGEVTDDDEMNALLGEQAELQEKIDAADAWDLNRKIEIAMDALRCPPGDADVTKLSGGERRRVALCRLLLQKPDLLLLDEPSLGLAPIIVQDLFQRLASIRAEQGVTMLVVEQNAALAFGIADRAYVLEAG
ncbi:MAG: ATP-binding cassette domain-containing protein, partial [Tagaea sp.]